MQKDTKNTASDGITTPEYSPLYTYYWYKIHQYFLHSITDAIQQLAEKPCTNCRELSNFLCKISCSFEEHVAKDYNKVSFHACAFTCTGKFHLCQAYPKIP